MRLARLLSCSLALAIGPLTTGRRAESRIAPLLNQNDAAAAGLAPPQLRQSAGCALAAAIACPPTVERAELGIRPHMLGEWTATVRAATRPHLLVTPMMTAKGRR